VEPSIRGKLSLVNTNTFSDGDGDTDGVTLTEAAVSDGDAAADGVADGLGLVCPGLAAQDVISKRSAKIRTGESFRFMLNPPY